MMRAGRASACLAALAAGTAALAAGPAPTPVRDIRFAAGQTSVEIVGQVRGWQGVDYRVVARAGQTLSVRMVVLDNHGLSFNVLPEGAAEAMAIGEHSDLQTERMLPDDGAYRIVTFLPRSAARRHERGRFRLSVAIGGQPLAPLPAARDALVAGTRYHATATVGCRWAYAPAAARCEVGVVRRGRDGTATLDIRGADGQQRRLLFVQGRLVASDSAWPVDVRRGGDSTTVEIDGQERHELPDALLTGG